MVHSVFRNSGKLFFTLATVTSINVLSFAAFAEPVAGCDPQVMDALTAKAEAQVAYDTAVTRELIDKPDSVLTLTCFDQAAGVSAKQGGAIFSGDFTTSLKTVMPVNGGGAFTCAEIDKLWKQISDQGINTGTPYATFDDLVNGNGTVPGGAGADFTAGWTAANGVFNNLKTAVTALPPPVAMDFTPAKSSCEVLTIAGIYSGSCP
jgi:hypothetical protein